MGHRSKDETSVRLRDADAAASTIFVLGIPVTSANRRKSVVGIVMVVRCLAWLPMTIKWTCSHGVTAKSTTYAAAMHGGQYDPHLSHTD